MKVKDIQFIAETTCDSIKQICQPLIEKGIHIFMYMRIYSNGEGIVLANNSEWLQFYLYNFYQLRYPNSIKFASHAEGRVFITRELYPELQELADAAEFYNFGNAICITKQLTTYKEFSYFAADKNNLAVINYYLNNFDFLELFISCFKVKAAKIIALSERHRVSLPKEYLNLIDSPLSNNNHEHNYNGVLHELPAKIILCDGHNEFYLTRRQIAIAQWLVVGKSAEEVAIILQISKRTVEEHINNMKDKLKCYKITSLIYKLSKYGYLFEEQ